MSAKYHRHSLAKKAQRKATTFRFAPGIQKRLELLGKLKKTTLNRLVNAAVEEYVESSLAETEVSLTDLLGRIRASRQVDANFDSAIAEFVQGEATLGTTDPVEGRPVEANHRRRKAAPKETPAQAVVREALRG